eukprot:jgi/Mesvir1/24634/Mv21943-RA.1
MQAHDGVVSKDETERRERWDFVVVVCQYVVCTLLTVSCIVVWAEGLPQRAPHGVSNHAASMLVLYELPEYGGRHVALDCLPPPKVDLKAWVGWEIRSVGVKANATVVLRVPDKHAHRKDRDASIDVVLRAGVADVLDAWSRPPLAVVFACDAQLSARHARQRTCPHSGRWALVPCTHGGAESHTPADVANQLPVPSDGGSGATPSDVSREQPFTEPAVAADSTTVHAVAGDDSPAAPGPGYVARISVLFDTSGGDGGTRGAGMQAGQPGGTPWSEPPPGRDERVQQMLARVAQLPASSATGGHHAWLPPSKQGHLASHPLRNHVTKPDPGAPVGPHCMAACPAVLGGYGPAHASSHSVMSASQGGPQLYESHGRAAHWGLLSRWRLERGPSGGAAAVQGDQVVGFQYSGDVASSRRAGIVLVHCDRDVSEYLAPLSCSFVRLYIYSKCPKTPPVVPPHLAGCTSVDTHEHSIAGMNALSYMEHLADHYDTLDHATFFVKDSNRHPFPQLLPELARASLEVDLGYYAFTNSLDSGAEKLFSGKAGGALYDAIFCEGDEDWRAANKWRTAIHSVFAIGQRRAWMWPRCKYQAIVDLIKEDFKRHKLALRDSWLMFEYSWGEIWRCRPQAWMQHNFVCVGDEGIAQNESLLGLPCTRA